MRTVFSGRLSPMWVVAAALLCLVAATGAGLDRLYGPDTSPVRELRRLYRLAAEPFPTTSFPVSRSWLRDAALDLEPEVPREISRRLADYLSGLGYDPTAVRTGVEVSLRPEAYLESSYLRGDITEKLRRESSAMRVRVSGGVDDGPLLHTRVDAIRDYRIEEPSNLAAPRDGDPIPYEFNNVYEGYLHWPMRFMAVTFGRQKLDLGPASRSSIVLAGNVPYLDALRLTMDLGPIRMHHHVASIDNFEAGRDVALSAADPTVYDFDRNQIFFNTHYFEYRFAAWRLGVGANLLVSRELNNFNLADFFPVFSWHNANLIPRNMSAFLDATVPVAPGLELYGQLSFDDIRTTDLGIGDEPIPTIPAGTLGARYTRLDGRRVWDLGLDAGYTHYLWGNYPRDYGLSRALYRLRAEGDGYAIPLTAPYGPGTVFGMVDAGVELSEVSVSLLYEVVGRKPDANLFTTEQAESADLAGQAYELTHRVEAEAVYRPRGWLALRARPGLYVTEGGVDAYLDLGGVLSFTGSRTVARVSE